MALEEKETFDIPVSNKINLFLVNEFSDFFFFSTTSMTSGKCTKNDMYPKGVVIITVKGKSIQI